MSKLSAAFRSAVLKLFKENRIPVQRFQKLKRLLAFSTVKVAGVGLVKKWHDADFLIATLFNLPHCLLQLRCSPKPARSNAYMTLCGNPHFRSEAPGKIMHDSPPKNFIN